MSPPIVCQFTKCRRLSFGYSSTLLCFRKFGPQSIDFRRFLCRSNPFRGTMFQPFRTEPRHTTWECSQQLCRIDGECAVIVPDC